MTENEVKLVYCDKVAIGHQSDGSSGDYTVTEGIIRFSDRMVSPEGALSKIVPVINVINPVGVVHNHRYFETELELNGDNLTIMRNQVVTNTSTTTRVLRTDDENDRIDYFAVNSVNQSGTVVSYVYQTQKNYLAYAAGSVSIRPGTTYNPTIYRFIHIGTKTIGSTTITQTESGDERYTGISKVTVNGTDVTNILDYSWEFVGPEGKDIVEPAFTPNVYAGVGVKEYSGKHWRMKLTFDTYSDAFNSYISQTSGNTVIPSLAVVLKKSDCSLRTHIYASGNTYVAGFAPSNVIENDTYHPGEIDFVCLGTRTDS